MTVVSSVRIMVTTALLVAMSIVLGKYLAINLGETMRFSFENLPILLAGMMFGPVGGLVAGIASDIIGCFLVGYAINPLVTVGAASIGFFSGIAYMLMKRTRLPYWLKISVPVFLAHLIGSVTLKTLGLSQFYDMPFLVLMLWRCLNYLIIGTAEYVLIYFIMKNKVIKSQFELFGKG